ncbi:DNA adenine methylase [Priestia megaterium]|uniref:DNA adenine methylase n=1 Tax=Priestia megaterium TaxID=1404 RepID=UPI0035D5E947
MTNLLLNNDIEISNTFEQLVESPVKRVKGIHSPILWFGGKYYLAKELISLMPKHHCYVEPFGGGGHVLTQKEPSKVEVYNDLDENLINFLLTLRSSREKLLSALESLHTSRKLFNQWSKEPLPEDSFERAVRWYYNLRHMLIPNNSEIRSGFRSGKKKSVAVDFQNSVVRLQQFEKRLRTVNIEMLDFKDCIRRYDSEQTLFFIDPPYVGRESMYKGGWTEDTHRELAELLRNIKGKALVTYYPDPLIDEIYKGWRRHEKEAYVGTVARGEGHKKKKETELFLMNYDENHNKISFEQHLTVQPKVEFDLFNFGKEEEMQLSFF